MSNHNGEGVAGDGGWDCIVTVNGVDLKVDVKITDRPDGNLIALASSEVFCDIFALVRGSMQSKSFEIAGWATKFELYNQANIREFGYGPTHIVNVEDLRDISELKTNTDHRTTE